MIQFLHIRKMIIWDDMVDIKTDDYIQLRNSKQKAFTFIAHLNG